MSAPSKDISTVAIRSEGEDQTLALATSLARQLRGGDVLALEGPLGSGKTCFVRGLASGLGINPAIVSSPTFVIRHEYGRGADSARPTLVHIDAYRLRGPDELESIGWSELLDDQTAIVAVEWPSRIAAAMPPNRLQITLEHLGESSRMITLTGPSHLMAHLEVPPGKCGAAKCRTCGKDVDEESSTFPFCSDRCRMSDLGRWFNESYRTSRAVEADDELSD